MSVSHEVPLLSTRQRRWTQQCDALLLSQGIASRWVTDPQRRSLHLLVPEDHRDAAAAVLSALLQEELEAPQRVVRPLRRPPLWLQPAFATFLCLAVLLVTFFWIAGGWHAPSTWFQAGMFRVDAFFAGQWWRLVTAACLHGDTAHALGNAAFLLVLGWAAAERVGPGVAWAVWLVTAVAGFAVPLLFGHEALTVGASGGLYGLLGANAGAALLTPNEPSVGRRHGLRALGAPVLLLAFTAFGPDANIPAHLSGFGAGLPLGALLMWRTTGRVGQALAAIGTAAVVVSAWMAALA